MQRTMGSTRFFRIGIPGKLLLRVWVAGAVLAVGGIGSSPAASLPEKVRYNLHIRPILADRCFACHGPDEKKREAELRLDLREGAMRQDDDHAAIVPGVPEKSELLLRILAEDPATVMPPPASRKPRLTADEVALLRKWIEQGAEYEGHWAFLPLQKEELPSVRQLAWARNPIDRFVLSRLEQEGIQPSPEADRPALIRRLWIDLLGLLPSPSQVQRFTSDTSPDACESLVDELLASPHYGERWGRHWLDQARYADSNGYANDGQREMWPWRDWVIQALNEDMPFDRFTVEQIAGDLLPAAGRRQLMATAFHRNTLINQEGGSDREQFRVESVIDRVNTTGAVWLGLTFGCAQCHSHKYDPISQREYYQFLAFFDSTEDVNDTGPTIEVPRGEVFGQSAVGATASTAKLMIMRELPRPRETFVLVRGDFTRPDRAAGPLLPGVPAAFLPQLSFSARVPVESHSAASRLQLAEWLVHPENPLTPRVTMNRIWMRYFGRGLVETDEDFGAQGAPPSHPELLDWLGGELIRRNWSLKQMHRLIVTSATYRQSAHQRHDLRQKDPRNQLLARQERVRFDAETARDAALCASGLLDRTVGGPSVFPPQPEGVYAFTSSGGSGKWRAGTPEDRYRRGLYTFFFRSAPYPLFTTFDAPDFQVTCTHRLRSNTPLQALTMANDAAFVELAQGLALRLTEDVPGAVAETLEQRIDHVWLLCLCRRPTSSERSLLKDYFLRELEACSQDVAAAEKLTSDALRRRVTPAEAAALVSLARLALNTDNFITRE